MTYEDLKGLKGGVKQQWLNNNKSLVLEYCAMFGPEKTCEQFYLQRETLESLHRRSNKTVPFSQAEKAMLTAQIAKQASNDLRREVQQLRQEFSQFQSSVAGQVANKVLLPWIQAAIQISEQLNVENEHLLDESCKGDFDRK